MVSALKHLNLGLVWHTLKTKAFSFLLKVDNAELKLNDKRPQTSRCHSVAEIISISDPRAPKSVKSTKARVTKSDTLLTSFQTDVSEDDFSGYHNPPSLGNIMFAGQLIKASPLYGCILTMGGSYHSCKEIPDNLRVGT